jgi:hypothetical protein
MAIPQGTKGPPTCPSRLSTGPEFGHLLPFTFLTGSTWICTVGSCVKLP